MNDSEQVLFRIDGPVATLTLNRPDKLNALTIEMLEAMEDAVARVDADRDIRVFVLSAAGERAFCAGADIKAWGALKPLGMWDTWIRRGHRIFDAIGNLRQPSIAAIDGIAFGGGLELAIACDLRIATDRARFALPETTIAAIPGWGGTQRMIPLIGVARTKQLVFTGAPIDAATASGWGLVNTVVAADELAAKTRETAERIAANAPVSVQAAKQLIHAGIGRDTGQILEAIAAGMAGYTGDAVEGRAAWQEKRTPDYKGE